MKSHCIACDGRPVPGTRRPGSGRLANIRRVDADGWLGWEIWNCPKCNLTWQSPISNDIGNAISENALANAGTDIIEADEQNAIEQG